VSTEPDVAWVFDVVSPFAYLGLPQLARLPARPRVVPVLLAALLQHYGQLGPAEIPSKRRFTYRFVLWRARELGLPLRLPPAHPFNPLPALRLILAAGSTLAAAQRVLSAAFADGLDVSAAPVIERLAAELGVTDPQHALADPLIKQRLHENTRWAIERGVFGVPTLVVGQELFWGQDALEMARQYLADPGAFADAAMRGIDTLPVGAQRRRAPPEA